MRLEIVWYRLSVLFSVSLANLVINIYIQKSYMSSNQTQPNPFHFLFLLFLLSHFYVSQLLSHFETQANYIYLFVSISFIIHPFNHPHPSPFLRILLTSLSLPNHPIFTYSLTHSPQILLYIFIPQTLFHSYKHYFTTYPPFSFA